MHDVGLLYSPLTDHRLVLELLKDPLLDFLDSRLLNLLDSLKARLVGEELVDVVNHQSQAIHIAVSRCSEPWTCLKLRPLNFNGL